MFHLCKSPEQWETALDVGEEGKVVPYGGEWGGDHCSGKGRGARFIFKMLERVGLYSRGYGELVCVTTDS